MTYSFCVKIGQNARAAIARRGKVYGQEFGQFQGQIRRDQSRRQRRFARSVRNSRERKTRHAMEAYQSFDEHHELTYVA